MTLSGNARLAGVMGWPIAHSRSPRLHGFWLDHYGIDGAYLPLAVHPDDFQSVLRTLPKMGFSGTNVTVPHKEAALACCDHVDDLARRIGAVNTVVIEPSGSLHGSNTDAYGFIENLRAGAPTWSAGDAPAVVLGAGGAARAVAVALLDAGVPALHLVNRTRSRAESLASDLADTRVVVEAWGDWASCLGRAGLLVNSTSLGMEGQPPLEIALDALPAESVVNDIVYTPLETPLLAAARQRGNPAVDGLGMLLHQARPGFSAWFGVDPAVTEDLRQHLLESL